MTVRIASLILSTSFLLAACNSGEAEARQQPAASESAPAAGETSALSLTDLAQSPVAPGKTAVRPAPEAKREAPVRLDNPSSYDTNPIVVTGTARTFEGHVPLRVFDASGILITTAVTTASGEIGTFSPFRKEIFLTRWPGDALFVESFEESAKDGSELGRTRKKVAFKGRKTTLKLYFAKGSQNQDCKGFVEVSRAMPVSRSALRLAVEALIAGPTADEKKKGTTSHFPPGTEVRGIKLSNAVASVDFNEPMSRVGGACKAESLRLTISKTLLSVNGVKSVRILAAGSETKALQP